MMVGLVGAGFKPAPTCWGIPVTPALALPRQGVLRQAQDERKIASSGRAENCRLRMSGMSIYQYKDVVLTVSRCRGFRRRGNDGSGGAGMTVVRVRDDGWVGRGGFQTRPYVLGNTRHPRPGPPPSKGSFDKLRMSGKLQAQDERHEYLSIQRCRSDSFTMSRFPPTRERR